MIRKERNNSVLPQKNKKAQALIILYETGTVDEKFKAQTYDLVIRIQKPLYIVALIPLINELSRTMFEAVNSKLDFKYYENLMSG